MLDFLSDNVTWLFALAFVSYFVFSVFTKKGRGKMMGGTIVETISTEVVQKEGMQTTTISAHVIQPKRGIPHVALEIHEKSKFGFSIRPIQLQREEARTLIRMLDEAVKKT